MRTTNKLTPCFVPRFPVWVKIAIDTVVLAVVRGVGWRGGVGAKGMFLFHKKLQQFCRICQREWGFVCLAFESMTDTPDCFPAFRSQKCREVPTITPKTTFCGFLRVKRCSTQVVLCCVFSQKRNVWRVHATTCFPSKGPPTSTCFHTPITLPLVVHPPQLQLPQPHHTTEQHKRKTKWK